MRKLFILLFIAAIFASCSIKIELKPTPVPVNDTIYQHQILLKNETGNTLQVRLYPNGKYIHANMYRFSDQGSGYRDMEFQLSAGQMQDLFTTSDTTMKAHMILKQVFDSIVITEGLHTLRFSADYVSGYQNNPYSSDLPWNDAIYWTYHMSPVKIQQSVFVLSGTSVRLHQNQNSHQRMLTPE